MEDLANEEQTMGSTRSREYEAWRDEAFALASAAQDAGTLTEEQMTQFLDGLADAWREGCLSASDELADFIATVS